MNTGAFVLIRNTEA